MAQFNFTTNIEKRMPATGKIFCVDRMTSDYAEQHPLDVDGFIESVYQEFVGTEFEESREALHSIWTAVLSVKNPRGDTSLYPNKNGRKRAAAMKVWAKAGDYWRRGFRHGDALPSLVPMTKITHLEDGVWIALFPKDAYLIENGEWRVENCATEEVPTDSTDETDSIEPVRNQCEPRQLDLFAFEQLKAENERLQAQLAQMQAQQCADRLGREDPPHRAQRQRRPVATRRQQPQPITAAVSVDSPADNDHAWLKAAGYLAAASVALLLIWQTGLLIPLGLIGLATSGLLK